METVYINSPTAECVAYMIYLSDLSENRRFDVLQSNQKNAGAPTKHRFEHGMTA